MSVLLRPQGDSPESSKNDWMVIRDNVSAKGKQPSAWALPFQKAGFAFIDRILQPNTIRNIVIIVDSDNVGRYAFPAIVTDDWPTSVDRFGQMVERLDKVTLLRAFG